MPNGFANIFHRKGGVDCTVVFLKSSVDELNFFVEAARSWSLLLRMGEMVG